MKLGVLITNAVEKTFQEIISAIKFIIIELTVNGRGLSPVVLKSNTQGNATIACKSSPSFVMLNELSKLLRLFA